MDQDIEKSQEPAFATDEQYEWYIANHYMLDPDLDPDPYAGSEWAGGQQCNN